MNIITVTAATFSVLLAITTTVAAFPIDSGDYYEGSDRNAAADSQPPSMQRYGYSGRVTRAVGPNQFSNRNVVNSGDYYEGAVRPN